MTEKVEVVFFPKLCPRCKDPMRVIKKFSGAWWYECTDRQCADEYEKAHNAVFHKDL